MRNEHRWNSRLWPLLTIAAGMLLAGSMLLALGCGTLQLEDGELLPAGGSVSSESIEQTENERTVNSIAALAGEYLVSDTADDLVGEHAGGGDARSGQQTAVEHERSAAMARLDPSESGDQLAGESVGLMTMALESGLDHDEGHGHDHATGTVDPDAPVRTLIGEVITFRPGALKVEAGVSFTIDFRNESEIEHDVTISGYEFQGGAHALPGGAAQVTFVIDNPGTYSFYCTLPGHAEAGMVGTLIVGAPHIAGVRN